MTEANWSRFEDVQAQVPVRFQVNGSQGGRAVDHQYDFFLIEEETQDTLMSDLQPTPGIGCPGFQSPPQTSFPGSKTTLPNQVAFSLEVYDIINNQNQTMIKRHDVSRRSILLATFLFCFLCLNTKSFSCVHPLYF